VRASIKLLENSKFLQISISGMLVVDTSLIYHSFGAFTSPVNTHRNEL